MGVLTFFLITIFVGSALSGFTEWKVLLWLRSDENMEPASVWSDSTSVYNSDTSDSLDVLFSSNRAGYRNTILDRWSDNPPDRIRISYRNKEGVPVYEAIFNSTNTTLNNWFVETKVQSGLDAAWLSEQFMTFDSHNSSFVVYDTAWGAQRYVAASITLQNGTVFYVVGNKKRPALLPAIKTDSSACYPSVADTNPFDKSITTSHLTHAYCSALCRDRNYIYGAVHNVTCSCILAADISLTTSIVGCTVPCEGDNTEMCGGPDMDSHVIFNLVDTEIDVSQFDQPLQVQGTKHVTGALEVSYATPKFIYGFNITIDVANLPVSIDMYLYHRVEQCNASTMNNITLIQTFTMSSSDAFYMLEVEPFLVQCFYIYLYETTTTNPISYPVHLDVITLKGSNFATADILTIEAVWEVADTCECECWLFSLLYGESPYDNLTYAEIEEALKNVTDQIIKELTVNVSTLSSTLRKKTSADDGRESATAIGYSLGVAILVCTLAAIILADIPKIIAGINLLHKSLTNGLCQRSVKQNQTK